ncbi:MAG TPA: protease inhibitor I42 family protein [Pseudomonas sp.]|jgi:inhibitor of cysteine peptidase|uniref:protease inhibitor I42 family protein n=1 Tax=Pseudomonas sp. TaxID=306 RepID=UPI002ED77B33
MTPARLLAPLGLCLLAACAQQPRHIVTLEKQSECPLTLKTGQILLLTLPSTPTTGYRWQIQNPAQGILRSMGPEVYSNPEDKNMVGSAGQSVWRYRAADAGSGHLMMVYQQPWAPEVAPERTFDCVITVNE